MLDTAEQVFYMIAECLANNQVSVTETFGMEEMLHVLPEFEGEQGVRVMTADDFLTRCMQIGLPALNQLQVACVIRVLGKPELGNAIRLNELEIVMSNFITGEPVEWQDEAPEQEEQDQPTLLEGSAKKDRRR